MKLIAKDTLRMAAASPRRVVKGEPFEINDAEGEALVARGLAEKQAEAPANKAEKASANKAAPRKAAAKKAAK